MGKIDGNGQSYEEFIKSLNNAGLNTTKIHTNRNEADFADYGFAMSDELQNMITESFDNEQDYVLQAELASLFGKKSNLDNGDFAGLCRANGYTVKTEYVKSSYLPDNKAGNRMGSRSLSTASLTVYTISDGKGGEIVIADTNGNGAIEMEELFMNQILSDIAVDVDTIKANYKEGVVGYSSGNGNNGIFSENKEEENKVSQTEFDEKVESFMKNGYSKALSIAKAQNELGTNELTYTGTYILIENSDKNSKKEISQQKFNSKVESLMSNGYDAATSIKTAQREFGTEEFSYTGNLQEEYEKLKEEMSL